MFPAEEVFVIETRESERSGQHVEEVVVTSQLDDDHEQDLNNENKKIALLYFTAKNEYRKQGDRI